MLRSPVRRTRSGRYQLRLGAAERELLRALPQQVRPLVESEDPSAHRLFPPAYDGDPEREADYRGLVHDELKQRHLRSLSLLEETAGRSDLDEEEVLGWLGALNDVRLVLGTQLDMTEDPPPPDPADENARPMAVYAYLSWLEAKLVDALGDPS
jgi:hypothetical protein